MSILIQRGMIVDGVGKPAFQRDVMVEGERIVDVGTFPQAQADVVIEAEGRMVCPGFIDIHNHAHDEAEGGILKIPFADNMLRQGVTTLIAGNCGGSPLPVGEHLEQVESLDIRMNYGLLAGHGSVRREVMGTIQRSSTEEERAQMKALLEHAMEEGAFGMSTGLAYIPGAYADTEEVVELASVVARRGGIYASHLRNEGTEGMNAVREAIRIAREADIPVEISHLKLWGKNVWGRTEALLGEIENARSAGLDVTADQYPYTAGYTGLGYLAPGWAFSEGKLKERLADPKEAARIRACVAQKLEEIGGAERILFAICKEQPEFEGKRLTEAADIMGKSALDAVMTLLPENGISAIYFAMQEEDVRELMRHPAVMIGTDGHLRKFSVGVAHPRNYGTFPRVLGRYSRDQGSFDQVEAVRKMTSMPADKLGLWDRGRIARGKIADITIFDPERVIDRATFEDGHRYSEGIETVLVGGRIAVQGGETTLGSYGRVLRKDR
jgi:dihydroorotase/N-acyl-D-amino-acid deacylase